LIEWKELGKEDARIMKTNEKIEKLKEEIIFWFNV